MALARLLQESELNVAFLVSTDNISIKKSIEACGYSFFLVNCSNSEEDAYKTSEVLASFSTSRIILIVDHYDLDINWISVAGKHARKVVVIDDLANRRVDCDLLVNQVYKTEASSYDNLITPGTRLLLGSKYSMLRPEFAEQRLSAQFSPLPGEVSIIHLLFGAGDPHGLCLTYAQAIVKNFKSLQLIINGTSKSESSSAVSKFAKCYANVHYILDSPNVAKDMALCHFALGTPGMSTWERACLGLPSMQISSSVNQSSIMKKLHDSNICYWLGLPEEIEEDSFLSTFESLILDYAWRERMRESCLRAVDGQGTLRLSRAILNLF